MVKTRLRKVVCYGGCDKRIDSDIWEAWKHLVNIIAVEPEWKFTQIIPEWRKNNIKIIHSNDFDDAREIKLYGIVFQIIDTDGEVLNPKCSHYNTVELEKQAANAEVEDWDIEFNQNLVPLALKIKRLYKSLEDIKTNFANFVDSNIDEGGNKR
jgi:hypothetical protein